MDPLRLIPQIKAPLLVVVGAKKLLLLVMKILKNL